MTVPTPPAVSEAMREAVDAFEEAVRQEVREARRPYGPASDVYLVVAARKDCRKRLYAEIARLTGERQSWENCALACELRIAAAEAALSRLQAETQKPEETKR